MPLYEYACRSCGERFEMMRPMAERLKAPECPACSAKETTLALSAPGMVGVAAGSVSTVSTGGSCSSDGGCCGGACGLN